MTAGALAAPLSLSGRYAEQGQAAAAAIDAWGQARGVPIEIHDDRSDPQRSAEIALELAARYEALLGPYGSGPARAVAAALADGGTVVWNHGGAAVTGQRGRWVDVLSPAERYWSHLPQALSAIVASLDSVAVLTGPSEFGRAVGAGAERALARAGHAPICRLDFDELSAANAADEAIGRGATVVVSGARIEEELALAQALAGRGVIGALVVCGIQRIADEIGSGVEGWIGPVQWAPALGRPPIGIGREPEYPAAQALAACLLVERARLRAARPEDATALWDAARGLHTNTFFGAFSVDDTGRQIGHAPSLVRWVGGRDGPERVPVAVATD